MSNTTLLKDPAVVATYVLDEPVDYAGVKIYQLEFRGLKTKDHLIVEKNYRDAGMIEKACAYLQLLTRQDPPVIEGLSHHDFLEASKIMNDFLEPRLKTTTTT